MEQMYMNAATGSVGPRDDWWYHDDDGLAVNAVDRGEVIAVVKDSDDWVEIEK